MPMQTLPEPKLIDDFNGAWFIRDQVQAIQRQAYEDALRDAEKGIGELYKTVLQHYPKYPNDYDLGFLDGIERAEMHIESLKASQEGK